LWGLLDVYGNEVVPAKYVNIHHFEDDLFVVESAGRYLGIINTLGEIVLPLEFTHIGTFRFPRLGHEVQFAPVNIGAEWIRRYDTDYSDGFGHHNYEMRGGLWGFIDIRGNLVVPPSLEYDIVRPVFDGMAAVILDGKWGFVPIGGVLFWRSRSRIKKSTGRIFRPVDYHKI